MQINWFQKNHAYTIKWINYLLLILIFLINFLGHPAVKYVYITYAVFVFLSILAFDFRTSIHMIVAFSFVEGQGRILLGYNPAARIAFDGLIVIATLRSFILRRDLKIMHLLPKPMLFFILFHFLWYIVEIFNIDSINMFAAIAGTKVYIFPFFLFIYFRQNEEFFDLENIKSLGYLIFFLLACECLLGLHQLKNLEGFMLGISPFYKKAMSGDIFTQDAFRPFGTTQLPGAISVFIYLTGGLLFIRPDFSKKYFVALLPLFILFFIVLLVCQVRSALLKFAVIVLGAFFTMLVNTGQRTKTLFRIGMLSVVLVPLFIFVLYPKIESFTSSLINLEAGLARWEGIEDVDDMASQRTGLDKAVHVAIDRLGKFPMGVGPAMTGAAGSLSVDLVKADPVYTKHTFWGYDNFYLSLIIEFGYGFIFYLCYILSVPIVLFYYYRVLYRHKEYARARALATCLFIILIILGGNWGAIGFSYNPESFYFWFWTAIGFNTFGLFKKEKGFQEI